MSDLMRVCVASEPAPGHENEDAYLCHGPVVGVLDGVTRPDGLDTGCSHSVAWYVTTLTHELSRRVDLTPRSALADLLAAAILAVNRCHETTCDLSNPNTPAATVALVRQGPETLEYLVLCEAYLVVDNQSRVDVITDARFAKAVAALRKRYLTGQHNFDSEAHMEQLRTVATSRQALTNTEAGYWIAAANPEAAHHAVTGTLPLTGKDAIQRLALLTDGATRAVDLFGLMNWREMLDLISESGPRGLIEQVRRAELADSNGQQWLRFKRHDDATAILCTFEEQM